MWRWGSIFIIIVIDFWSLLWLINIRFSGLRSKFHKPHSRENLNLIYFVILYVLLDTLWKHYSHIERVETDLISPPGSFCSKSLYMSFRGRTYFRRSIKVKQEHYTLKFLIERVYNKVIRHKEVARYCDLRQIITLTSPVIKTTCKKWLFMNWQQKCYNKNNINASSIINNTNF